jgi:hypothetical protein
MKKLFLIEIGIYILEIVVTTFLAKDSIFLPLFGYFYVLMTAEELEREKDQFFFCFLSGLFYDLLISSTPFMNTFLFCFLPLVTKPLHIQLLKSGFSFLFHFLVELALYRTCTYFVLILIQYQNFSGIQYRNSFLFSIVLNLFFVLCYKFLLRKRRDKTFIYQKRRVSSVLFRKGG